MILSPTLNLDGTPDTGDFMQVPILLSGLFNFNFIKKVI